MCVNGAMNVQMVYKDDSDLHTNSPINFDETNQEKSDSAKEEVVALQHTKYFTVGNHSDCLCIKVNSHTLSSQGLQKHDFVFLPIFNFAYFLKFGPRT